MTLPITDFIVERLLEYDSTFDVGGGIATTALMINPLAVILQPLRDELDEIQANQSVLSVLEATDPDAVAEDVVDALASNVFISRNQGNKSSGTVRVRYFSPTSVDIGTGLASFLDENGVRVINVNPISISASQMSLNLDGSLYYVDIPCIAEAEGEDGNIAVGGIQTWENEPANVANITNVNAFTGGVDRETNTDLIERIKVAVTVRALVTGRGITTTMMNEFASIVEINPRGFGDPEMQRDIIYNTHVGGNVDVWVKTAEFTEEDYDVIGITVDTTRQARAQTSVIMETAGLYYQLRGYNIDRTAYAPVVNSTDNYVTYTETTDYVLYDAAGQIKRVNGGNIFHCEGTTGGAGGIQADAYGKYKILNDTNIPFTNVRKGMQLRIFSPPSCAGVYTVKSNTAQRITINGEFPTAAPIVCVHYHVDESVTVTYDYNPLSIDIISSARSSGRTNYTITDVPVMRIKTIEVLDSSTRQPTGTFLDATGGYGQGPYGAGPYGIGTVADYVLKVVVPNLRFSALENNYIDIKRDYLGYNLRVTYDYAPEIATYQDYVDDPLNRVEPALLVVKHFIPVFISTVSAITYKVKASNLTAKTASEIQSDIEDFIDETHIKNALEISDIIDMLYDRGADEVNVNIELRGEIHNTDGSLEFIDSSEEGILTIPNRVVAGATLPDTDKPLSQEIAHFLPGTILLTRVTI